MYQQKKMKLIESKAEYIPQTDLYKHIEICGRTAYKSEDKITENSAEGFVDRMIKSKHGAVLEHGTVYLIIPERIQNSSKEYQLLINNPYTKAIIHDRDCYITTNYRVIIENNITHMMVYTSEPTEFHEKRYTIKFTTDRGISHELVRHRKFSFVQESQRYCNYSKDKFGGELTFVKPSFITVDELPSHIDRNTSSEVFKAFILKVALDSSESDYFDLIKEGCTPQEARAILPNAIKTEILMTGFASDWRFFFDLRYYGETGKPHPDMELLAGKAREEFIKAGIWEDIISKPSKFDK